MPGPAPKSPDARRRRNAPLANTVRLPAEGRQGDPPAWPLSDPSPAAAARWERLWATPQAAAWERLGWFDVVARYVQVLIFAEQTMTATLLGEVRQLEDRLGLSPMAMLRLRWEVVADELGEARTDAPAPKRKLRAVDTGGVAGS